MFCRENFNILCEAVDEVTTSEKAELKAGARMNLYYLLLKSTKLLRDKLFLQKEDVHYDELNKFYEYLKANEDVIKDAIYSLNNRSLKQLRKPDQLPLDQDIDNLHNYIFSQISQFECAFEFWEAGRFIELRNLTFLTK